MEVKESPFPDLGKERWSYGSILPIFQRGYITGFDDGTFQPTAKSTRVQMATLMERMAEDFENMGLK